MNEPALVLADEPTGNLDPDLALEIMNLFRDINARGHHRAGGDARPGTDPPRRPEDADARSRPPDGGGVTRHGTLTFCVREAAASLWRQRGSTVLSALTIAVAIAVLGAFLVVTFNLDRALASWSAAAELTVYLRDDITPEQRADLNRLLTGTSLVAGRTYVSKADALERFKRDFPDLAPSATALEQNPMPASIEVRLAPALATSDAVEALATRVGVAAGVADVRFDRQWLARLARWRRPSGGPAGSWAASSCWRPP